LKKIMDALKHIDIVWPSAGRAWELLSASKVHDAPIAGSISCNEPRTKRGASESAHEDGATEPPPAYMPQQSSPGVDASPGSAPFGYFGTPQYERWPPLAFAGGLSTSALPQQYSTGLVDHRTSSSARQSGTSTPVSGAGGRYPQYWNDYSTLGQLGLTYGMQDQHHPQLAGGSSEPASSGQPAQSFQAQQTQYDMFGLSCAS
jgi:hypothetical protein